VIGAGCVVAVTSLLSVLLGLLFLIAHIYVDNVAHCGQNRAMSSLLAVCLCQRYDD
jgi:hypothetical protein